MPPVPNLSIQLAPPNTLQTCPPNGSSMFNISLLIGADNYWDVVENEIIRGDGPTAVKSKIGFLMSESVTKRTPNTPNHVLNVLKSRIPEVGALESFRAL